MIYEYPEKFVVPVVYVEDLKEKSMNRDRDWDIKYIKVEKLVVPDKKMQYENISQEGEYETGNFYEDIMTGKNYIKFSKSLLEKPYHKEVPYNNKIDENLENDHMGNILKDIDDDYANSETLRM
jgi:hypothetical protein